MPHLPSFVVAIAIQILLGCGPAATPSTSSQTPATNESPAATPSTSSQTPATNESPAPTDVPVGGRLLIIEVSNTGDRNAVLFVGRDVRTNFPDIPKAGNANPPLVPPHATIRVIFTVPHTDDWAIFVNPKPESGPLLSAFEFGSCVGFVPITILVEGSGEPSWTSKARDAPPCMDN